MTEALNTCPAINSVHDVVTRFALQLPDTVAGYAAGQAMATTGVDSLEHICPSTEESLYRLAVCDAGTVDTAVRAARRVADSHWARLSHSERKPVFHRMIDAIDRHQDELAAIQALEVGLPLSGVQAMHMPRTIENFEFFLEVAGTLGGHCYTQTGNYTSIVTREPVGVLALIAPWNAPLVLSSMKLAAALALGNSVVIKASEYSPYSLYRFVEVLHEADLPPGLINLVNGPGPITGDALAKHPDVDVIGLVGGTQTGRAIVESSAAGLKKVGLELGGKSANIVLDSANFEAAIDGSLIAMLAGNGEQCLAGSRILVQEGIADDFIDTFVTRVGQVRIGDPFDAATELGPMAFARHRDRVLSYASIAAQEGAEVLHGGIPCTDFERGYYIHPTVVLTGDNSLRVCQEEIFGPFVTIQRFASQEQAVALANDSPYGLVSYLWSDDLPSVMDMSRQIKAGTVWVNTPLTRDLRAPFGGYKQSGIGRDGLHSSVELLTEEKTVMLPNQPLQLPKLGTG